MTLDPITTAFACLTVFGLACYVAGRLDGWRNADAAADVTNGVSAGLLADIVDRRARVAAQRAEACAKHRRYSHLDAKLAALTRAELRLANALTKQQLQVGRAR